jgi:hypothetical protein
MKRAIQLNEFVTDTMGLVLWLERRKINPKVRAIYESAESGNATENADTYCFREFSNGGCSRLSSLSIR